MNEDANCPEGHVTPQKSILIAAVAAGKATLNFKGKSSVGGKHTKSGTTRREEPMKSQQRVTRIWAAERKDGTNATPPRSASIS